AKGFRKQCRALATRSLGQDWHLKFLETSILGNKFGMIMAEEVGAESAYEVEHFNQSVAFSLPEPVAFSAFIDRVQTERLQHAHESRPAIVPIVVHTER